MTSRNPGMSISISISQAGETPDFSPHLRVDMRVGFRMNMDMDSHCHVFVYIFGIMYIIYVYTYIYIYM